MSNLFIFIFVRFIHFHLCQIYSFSSFSNLFISVKFNHLCQMFSSLSSQSMIVDQTIEKVSFCAPDRNHEKGFAYICRDGTTRRWMCHGFLAVKESVRNSRHELKCFNTCCLYFKFCAMMMLFLLWYLVSAAFL